MSDLQPLFLFSLPRSGSTLVQRMLGAHPEISTCSEPWVLLPHLYSLREEGVFAEYSHTACVTAIRDFGQQLPDGQAGYLRAIKRHVMDLYVQASAPHAKYFLDKTPRYSLIANDIINLFDEGRFLVLWRNPLAVLASIVDTWFEGRWMPYLRKIDLFEGLTGLIDAVREHPSRVIVLHYEDLVTDPSNQMQRILTALGLPWSPRVVADFSKVSLKGQWGDPTGVRRYTSVSVQPLDKWKTTLASPVRRLWCRRYLHWIGRDRLAVMGYDIDELLAALDELPLQVARVPSDLMLTARGVAWNLTEPRILRHKLARFPQWSRITGHT